MAEDLGVRQRREWRVLYSQIEEALQQFGEEWDYERDKGDYLVRDDNWGRFEHRVDVQNLDLLKPVVIKSLQNLLAGYPDWEIVVAVDIPEKKEPWPAMGLVICDNEIID